MDFDQAGRDAPEETLVRGLPLRYWRAWFGAGDTYYTEQLMRLEAGQRLAFNWYALLFNYYWLLFRKMYFVALALFIIGLVLGTVQAAITLLQLPGVLMLLAWLPMLAVRLGMGFFGNRIYLWQAEQRIKRTIANGPPLDRVLIPRMRDNGGTSWANVIILLLVLAVIRMIMGQGARFSLL